MKRLITLLTFVTAIGLAAPTFAQPADEAPTPAPEVTAEPAAAPAPAPAAEPAPAPAAEPAPPVPTTLVPVVVPEPAPAVADNSPALAELLTHAIKILGGLLALMLIWLSTKGVTFFEKKTSIDIPLKTEEMIAGWAEHAAGYAEEQAHKFLKKHEKKMEAPDKLEAGLGFGLALAEEYGLPNLAKDKLTKYIEARLGIKRTTA
jgi:hypothetical protein